MKIFAHRLKMAREIKGWSQKELAKRSKCSQNAVSNYERGVQLPSLENAADLAVALGVSLDWLTGLSPKIRVQRVSPQKKG